MSLTVKAFGMYILNMQKIFQAVSNLAFKVIGAFSKEIILFESFPEVDGSPWMIYQEMKRRGFDKKYKLVWAVDKDFRPPAGVKSVPFFGRLSRLQRSRRVLYKTLAKLIVDSNRPVYKKNPNTIRIFVRHGGPFKKCPDYMHSIGEVNYMLTLSQALQEVDFVDCKDYCVQNMENIVPLGFPANDRLFEEADLFANGFYPTLCQTQPQKRFAKIIGWLPTFRQHRIGGRVDSEKVYPFGVPLVQSEEELVQLNQILNEKDILLVIQMHHAQAANFSKLSFSNIVLMDQNLKYKMGVSTANLMQSFDALITDYSAAYHEYVMLNRPVALAIDDFEEYSSKTGFVFDYFEWIKGVYLKTLPDLLHFVDEVANGVDSAKSDREMAARRIHKYIDNQSTKRVVDFLVEKAGL